VYYHVAGHLEREDGSLLDTHGRPTSEEVVALARHVLALHGDRPIVLERDHNVPGLAEMTAELRLVDRQMRGAVHGWH
jgi:uncharacterized protein (UPF0276 family)